MKLLTFVVIFAALAFCSLGERLKQLSGESSTAANSSSTTNRTSSADAGAERPKLTPAQQAIADSATDVKWDEQGVTWRLPAGWKKMDQKKETFNYGSPDRAFLLVNISAMASDFPMDASRDAFYKQAMDQLQQGKYLTVRYLDIDGIKGVEWIEAPPEDKDGPRRHQWIGYRNYLGQNQMLNVMLSTEGSRFDKHKDEFAAIMYSTRFAQ
ncbi:MAG: hypothetical protein ACK4S4_10770 [Pyrinomonadaceae bacterium]